jgi:hypothetical protein
VQTVSSFASNACQYDAAVAEAQSKVAAFNQSRSRVLGDYYKKVSDSERVAAFDAALPRISKRMGLKPEDVGTALLAHMHASVSAAVPEP